jgi:hypothetical protein
VRNKFLEQGIPFDKLDQEMIALIDVFNFHLGMKTKYCCYGHDSITKTHVIFDDETKDSQIYELAQRVCTDWKNHMHFKKWVRLRGKEIASNWIFEIGLLYKDPNNPEKKIHFDKVVEIFKNY